MNKLICIPPLKYANQEGQYEWINPNVIDFIFCGMDNSTLKVIIVFNKSCDRGNKSISDNQAKAVIKQLHAISIIPQFEIDDFFVDK